METRIIKLEKLITLLVDLQKVDVVLIKKLEKLIQN